MNRLIAFIGIMLMMLLSVFTTSCYNLTVTPDDTALNARLNLVEDRIDGLDVQVAYLEDTSLTRAEFEAAAALFTSTINDIYGELEDLDEYVEDVDRAVSRLKHKYRQFVFITNIRLYFLTRQVQDNTEEIQDIYDELDDLWDAGFWLFERQEDLFDFMDEMEGDIEDLSDALCEHISNWPWP